MHHLLQMHPEDLEQYKIHSVKNAQIWSFFWSVFSCIRTEYRKYGSEKTAYLDSSRSDIHRLSVCVSEDSLSRLIGIIEKEKQ